MSSVTVLGIGNLIMADDGVGPELLARLAERRASDSVDAGGRVTFVDGGIQGMELLPDVQDASRLLILDAVAGSQPGAVVHLVGDAIPRMLASKLSPHQVGVLDVLTSARLLGREPERVDVVGVVPEFVDFRVGLSSVVEAALDEAVGLASEVLDELLAS